MRRHRRNIHGAARWLSNPIAAVLGALAVALLLAGCAEKPQDQAKKQAGTTVTWDTRPWEAERTPFTVPGVDKGSRAAYEDALKQRAQGQNEYVRIGASQ
jgi:type IV pilus biogenesis protein CpaD/CtpE